MIHSCWLMASLIVGLPRVCLAAEASRPIGWQPDIFSTLTENASDSPAFHREFYPNGEGASHWTERVVVSSRTIALGTNPVRGYVGIDKLGLT
jgi:hypothetical protein